MLILMACNRSHRSEDHTKQKEQISAKYGALYASSDLDGYVYQLQERIIQKGRPLCVIGKMTDMVKGDSFFTMRLKLNKSENDKYYLGRLKVGDDLAIQLKEQINEKKYSYGVFVFSVSEIILEDGKETEEEPDGDSYDYDITAIIFKGELIDFSIFNKN